MTDPKLLQAQHEALLQAQRAARLRGETRLAGEASTYLKSFRGEHQPPRTFEAFCEAENRRLRPYPWMTR